MNICGVTLAEAWPLASSQPAAMMKRGIAGLQEGSPAHFTVFRMKPSTTSDDRSIASYQPEFSVAGGIVYR
jgi:dihydroorotase-like cyclic amidohydrolase